MVQRIWRTHSLRWCKLSSIMSKWPMKPVNEWCLPADHTGSPCAGASLVFPLPNKTETISTTNVNFSHIVNFCSWVLPFFFCPFICSYSWATLVDMVKVSRHLIFVGEARPIKYPTYLRYPKSPPAPPFKHGCLTTTLQTDLGGVPLQLEKLTPKCHLVVPCFRAQVMSMFPHCSPSSLPFFIFF